MGSEQAGVRAWRTVQSNSSQSIEQKYNAREMSEWDGLAMTAAISGVMKHGSRGQANLFTRNVASAAATG